MMLTTAEGFAAIVSQRVSMERITLAEQWLGRLRELLTVEPNDVFPSDQLLDHIPLLIANIATYLRAPQPPSSQGWRRRWRRYQFQCRESRR